MNQAQKENLKAYHTDLEHNQEIFNEALEYILSRIEESPELVCSQIKVLHEQVAHKPALSDALTEVQYCLLDLRSIIEKIRLSALNAQEQAPRIEMKPYYADSKWDGESNQTQLQEKYNRAPLKSMS